MQPTRAACTPQLPGCMRSYAAIWGPLFSLFKVAFRQQRACFSATATATAATATATAAEEAEAAAARAALTGVLGVWGFAVSAIKF